MKKIAISVESTADLPKEVLSEHGFFSLPFHLTMGEETYLDGEKTNEDIFEYGNTHPDLARTSAPNVSEYQAHFQRIKEQGYEGIVHFSISSLLSGGYRNALAAKGEDDSIEIVDSGQFSLGIAMLAFEAERLLKEGVTDDVHELKRLSLPVKDKEDVSLMISDLKFMAKGGRCPSLVAKLLSPLPLKVSVYTKEGKLSLAPTLLLGNMGKAVRKYIDSRLRLHEGKIDFSLAALGYTSATRDGVEEAVNHLKSRGFQEVLAVPTNATDACHGGPDVIGFAFRFLD